MNFLELCQKVSTEAGITTTGPTSVVAQTGILSKVVSWVRQADIDIQLERSDWFFLWKTTQANLVANKSEYMPVDLAAGDINVVHLALIDSKAAQVLQWTDYVELYRKTGKQADVADRPSAVARSPNGKFYFYPVPLLPCKIQIDYSTVPVHLTSNMDVPKVPERFHYAIVQKALMYYAEHEEDINRYNQARLNYLDWLNVMGRDTKPRLRFLNE